MIKITQGQANTVVLTLTERATLDTPTFLFHFKSLNTHKNKYFLAADTSSYTYRYNEFSITESSSEDVLNGTVELDTPGEWLYWVYEQSSTTNLDPTQADNAEALETGLVNVLDPSGDLPVVVERRNSGVTYKMRE